MQNLSDLEFDSLTLFDSFYVLNLIKDFDEIICVFDTYKQDSLKNRTRHLRQKGRDPTQYQVRDETCLKNTPLSRFLSHNQTKSDLTKYLAEKVQLYNAESDKIIITSAAGHTNSNVDLGPFPDNNHEEADTLMICLGVFAAERHSKKAQITFFSPDTDVLVLLVANFDRLPTSTSISMASGIKQIEPIWKSLGPERSKALLGLHAFSGTDNTGRFAGVGKKTWMKLFLESSDAIVDALTSLCVEENISENNVLTLAKLVCKAYRPKGLQIESIPEIPICFVSIWQRVINFRQLWEH